MIAGTLVLALALADGADLASTAPGPTAFGQGQPAWSTTDSQHFEVHYLPEQAGELERVVRIAEGPYWRVSNRLNFVRPAKVPLVLFAPSSQLDREQVLAYAMSAAVAPPRPHRSRIVLPLPEDESELEALTIHELTHLLVSEIVRPGAGGDGGVPRWVQEGIANYMVGAWPDDDEHLMRELVASGSVPALSQLTGSGGFANARQNYALGHAAFDYIDSRRGPAAIRRFLNTIIVPRGDTTYDAVFELTPAEFDLASRQYAERRFGPK